MMVYKGGNGWLDDLLEILVTGNKIYPKCSIINSR